MSCLHIYILVTLYFLQFPAQDIMFHISLPLFHLSPLRGILCPPYSTLTVFQCFSTIIFPSKSSHGGGKCCMWTNHAGCLAAELAPLRKPQSVWYPFWERLVDLHRHNVNTGCTTMVKVDGTSRWDSHHCTALTQHSCALHLTWNCVQQR